MPGAGAPLPGLAAPRTVAHLDFTVRVVRSTADLAKAVQVRHAAFARHRPDFAQLLRQPEPDDTAADCTLLLAERKADGLALGSMRMQVNSARPLPVETRVPLPAWLAGRRLADARRLCVAQGPQATAVRLALFKAFYLRSRLQPVDWAVVAARPPLTRLYEHLQFREVLGGQTYTPHPLLDEPHQVLALELGQAQRGWEEAGHPLLGYMCDTEHPDIDVGAGAAA